MPAIGNFAPEVDVPTKSVFDAPRLILLLNTIQIIGNSENAGFAPARWLTIAEARLRLCR